MTEDELDLTTTDDLVSALLRRQGNNGALILVTLDLTKETESKVIYYRGGWTVCLGLLEYAKYNLFEPFKN